MLIVTCAVIKKDDKIFIARRNPDLKLGGSWEFPGGKLEKGETTEECIVREMNEEFGITTKVNSFLGRNLYDYNNKTINLLAYHVEWLSGEMLPIDHDATAWVAPENLSKYNLTPGDVPFIKLIQEKL